MVPSNRMKPLQVLGETLWNKSKQRKLNFQPPWETSRSFNCSFRGARKYGALCRSVAQRLLADPRDTEECVSDTYLRAWNVIPPERPRSLRAYLARITRNLALDRYKYNTAAQRSTALTDAFEDLATEQGDPDTELDASELRRVLNGFLRRQSAEARVFFLRRYWYGESIREIAEECCVSEAKVKTSLFRTRERLRTELEQERIRL